MQTAPATGLPMVYVYGATTVGGVLLAIVSLHKIAAALATESLFTNQMAAYKASPEVYTQRSYLQTLARNSADSAVYQSEKQLKEFGDKVPADLKGKVEAAQATLKEAIAKDDVEGMKKGMEALQAEVMAIGQAVYSQAGAAATPEGGSPGADGAAPGGAAPGAGAAGGDDNVIDADFSDSGEK